MEVESASRTLVNIALREFRESEAHVNRPGATSYALGRCAEVGYMAAHHLHHGLQVVRVGWGPWWQSLCQIPGLHAHHTLKMVFLPSASKLVKSTMPAFPATKKIEARTSKSDVS